MFILYAIPIGIVIGFLAGGRLQGLADLRLRWVPLMLLGFAVQVVIFTEAGGRAVGDLGPAIYVASTLAVFAAVLRNVAVPGVVVIAIGAGSNLAAIIANGGWMPADPAALESIGGLSAGFTNSILVADPPLQILTDVYALPTWLPLANVFSVGDAFIGAGIAATIALAMRSARGGRAAGTDAEPPATHP